MYYDGYPKKRIGKGNPYYCCAACGISDPQINGRIEGHLSYCSWRKSKEHGPEVEEDIVLIPKETKA